MHRDDRGCTKAAPPGPAGQRVESYVFHTMFPFFGILQTFSKDDIFEARGISVETGEVLVHVLVTSQVTHEWVDHSSMMGFLVSFFRDSGRVWFP